jgi:hypothetical protein
LKTNEDDTTLRQKTSQYRRGQDKTKQDEGQYRTDTRLHNKTTIVRVRARLWFRVRVGVRVRVRVTTGLTYFALFGNTRRGTERG